MSAMMRAAALHDISMGDASCGLHELADADEAMPADEPAVNRCVGGPSSLQDWSSGVHLVTGPQQSVITLAAASVVSLRHDDELLVDVGLGSRIGGRRSIGPSPG
jgi:hypothetical protein